MTTPRPTLQAVVRQLLQATEPTHIRLAGGLVLKVLPRHGPHHKRLIAARQRTAPSDRELTIVQRELQIAVQQLPLVAVGRFQRLEPQDQWYGAEIFIYYPTPFANEDDSQTQTALSTSHNPRSGPDGPTLQGV